MSKTELEEAEKSINDLYDAKQADRQAKQDQADKVITDREKEVAVNKANALVLKMEEDKMTDIQKLDYQMEQDLLTVKQLENSEEAEKAVREKYANEKKILEENAAKHKADMLIGEGMGLLSSMGSMMKQGSKAQQDFAVASATVDMFTGMSKVWGLFGTPEVTSDTLMKTVSSANILATGMANIKNIKKAGKGGGGGAVPSVQAPSINVMGRSTVGERELKDAIEQGNAQPTRAYVVESDMASSSALARRVDSVSSMG